MSRAPRGTKRSRPLRRRLLLSFLTFLLCIGLAESCLWLLFPVPHPYKASGGADREVYEELRRQPRNKYVSSYYQGPRTVVLTPDQDHLPGTSPEVVFSINRFGFRNGRMSSVTKREGAVRVFMVGGSTTECMYNADAASWPEVVHHSLVARAPDVNVINSGHSGDTTRNHLDLVAHRLVRYEPDVLVFLPGINDVTLQVQPDYSPRREAPNDFIPESEVPVGQWLKARACDWSQVFRRVVQVRRGGLTQDARGNAVQDSHGAWLARERRTLLSQPAGRVDVSRFPGSEFEQNLRSLVALARAQGALPVLVTQPALWGADPGDWQRLLAWSCGGKRVPPDQLWELLEGFNQVTRRVGAETRVLVVDLARDLPKEPDLFFDDVHFSDRGAQAVGRIVARGLWDAEQIRKRLKAVR